MFQNFFYLNLLIFHLDGLSHSICVTRTFQVFAFPPAEEEAAW
jgi:hypothetical protein